MKVKELLEYLKEHEDYELEIFAEVYTLDTIAGPEKKTEIGELQLYDRELWDKKVVLKFVAGEELMYMADLNFYKGCD